MKFVFFGTPELSVDILETLKRHGLVPSVIVTNPDRPQGRKMVLTPPPVKLWALANNIPCLQPESPSGPDFLYKLQTINYKLFIVVAYGSLLPKELLAIPEKGSLNIHYSLLPKYRGASPIESQILADDKDAGVSILLLDEEMDHGPTVAKQQLEIQNPTVQIPNKSNHQNINISKYQNDSLLWPPKASELRSAMNTLAGEMLAEVMPKWVEGKIEAKPQDHSKATYTKKFKKADGEINLADDGYKNYLKIQAFESSIGTFFFTSPPFQGGDKRGGRIRVIIKSAEFRDGNLILTRVVPEGKKEMSYEEFQRGMK
ncbi:MAG: Methionyl-tRNA formyltransferase [Parcubacteria group bacterium GW2011_GWA2_49_9]|nr:MAG: Methionyl-tRNA formyltransferase [Parcubacteria group bacterium GW2011_GWA2_49_9]